MVLALLVFVAACGGGPDAQDDVDVSGPSGAGVAEPGSPTTANGEPHDGETDGVAVETGAEEGVPGPGLPSAEETAAEDVSGSVTACDAGNASVSPASDGEGTGEGPAPLDPCDFALTSDMSSLAPARDALTDELGSDRHRSVSDMMDAANRTLEPLCNRSVYQPVADQSGGDLQGFCWQDGDDATEYWYTQGTTTTADATDSGSYDGEQLVAVSWYHRPDDDPSTSVNKGVRISFASYDSGTAAGDYRHVLLVEPVLDDDGDPDFVPVPIHAGGMFWYEDLLYVADTRNGFRIFDMNDLYVVETGDADAVGRQSDGSYHAFNYALILPQSGWARDSGEEELRYSFAGLDRSTSPHSFVVGEYAPPEGGGTRVVRYPLDPGTGLPLGGDDGPAHGAEAYDTGILQMQGVVSRNGRWWFAGSNGRQGGPAGRYGFLRVWDGEGSDVRVHDWAYGPEDLAYGSPDGSERIWTNTEYPGFRTVFGAPAAVYD